MYKSKALYVVVLAAFLAMALSTDAVATFPKSTGNPLLLKGTYGFNFSGDYYDEPEHIVGNGSFIADGKGDITGGEVFCNSDEYESDSNIVGGAYFLDPDGTGFMTVDLDSEFCDSPFYGFDLRVSVVGGGVTTRFSSDAEDIFYLTGVFLPFTGTADLFSPNPATP